RSTTGILLVPEPGLSLLSWCLSPAQRRAPCSSSFSFLLQNSPRVRTPSQLWSSVVSLPTLFLLHHFQIQPFVLPKEDVCSLEGCGGLQLRLA
ncbi:hypothetical protein LEMLEM_LOCUS2768, partial [Lemmus lemmus]